MTRFAAGARRRGSRQSGFVQRLAGRRTERCSNAAPPAMQQPSRSK